MMKKRILLAVTALLMVLGFLLPIGHNGSTTGEDETITICSNCPPIDTFKLW